MCEDTFIDRAERFWEKNINGKILLILVLENWLSRCTRVDPANGLCNVPVMLCNCPFRYLRSTLYQRIMKLLTEIMDRKQSFLYLKV